MSRPHPHSFHTNKFATSKHRANFSNWAIRRRLVTPKVYNFNSSHHCREERVFNACVSARVIPAAEKNAELLNGLYTFMGPRVEKIIVALKQLINVKRRAEN
jgi:hypothetical protein